MSTDVDKWRGLVVISFNNILSDIARVSNESQHVPVLTSLDFTARTLNHYPEIFIPPSPPIRKVPSLPADAEAMDSTDVDAKSDAIIACCDDDMSKSPAYALSCWAMSHLCQILAVPGHNAIHVKTSEVLVCLLRSTASQNPFAFRQLVHSVLACLADLCKVYENFFSDDVEPNTHLEHFQSCMDSISAPSGEQLVLTRRPLTVGDPESCQQLQIHLSLVLLEITLELSTFAFSDISFVDNSNDCCILWTIVSCQLEYGDVQLKSASLHLAAKLVTFAVPPAEALDYFLNCLVSLCNLLCVGISELCDVEDSTELETCLAEAVDNVLIFVVSTAKTLSSSASPRTSHDAVLETLVSGGIMQSVAKHGMARLTTCELRTVFCRCVTMLIETVGFQPEIHLDFFRRLVEEICDVKNSDLAVQKSISDVLYAAIASEQRGRDCVDVQTSKTKCCPITNSLIQPPQGPSVSFDSESSGSSRNPKMFDSTRSLVAQSLETKLEDLLSIIESHPKSCTGHLGGLWTVIDTLARCRSFYISDIPQSTTPTPGQPSNASFFVTKSVAFSRLIAAWHAFLVQTGSADDMAIGYGHIVCSVGSVFSAPEAESMSVDEMSQIVVILSLPWLVGEVGWMDLKLARFEKSQLGAISKIVSECAKPGTISNCLSLLAIMPRLASPRWRKRVVEIAASDVREEVRQAAVLSVPNLLHSLGPSSHHIIKDVLSGLLMDSSTAVKESLAEIVGNLACVISSTSLRRQVERTSSTMPVPLLELVCTFCSLSLPKDRAEKSSSLKTCESAPMLLPLVKSLAALDTNSIKLILIRQFKCLFRHIWYWPGTGRAVDLVSTALSIQQDPDSEVRHAFVHAVKYLVAPSDVEAARPANDVIFAKLKTFDKLAAENLMNESILSCVGEIATVAEGSLLLCCIIMLLNAILFPASTFLEVVALQQLQHIASSRRVSLPLLYLQFGQRISESIAACLHHNLTKSAAVSPTKSARPKSDPTVILQKVADVFGFDDLQDFVKSTEHLLVPHVVRRASPTSSALLKDLARIVNDSSHKKLIARTIGSIYCHLVCSCETDEMERMLTFVEAEMEQSLGEVLRGGEHIDSLLVVHLSSSEVKVINALKVIMKAKARLKDVNDCTTEQLAAALQPSILGILVFFDKHLKNETIAIADKRQAFHSLIYLMKLMGCQHITAVRVHVMTTLKIGQQFPDRQFAELCCDAWDCFVRLLEVTVLGPMLSQIVANLLPLLQAVPTKVAAIFQYLFVDRQSDLAEHLHELYFIPDIPELAVINLALRPHIDAVYSGRDLAVQIEHLLKGAGHESLDIRQMALLKLMQSLRTNKDVLHGMILNNETVHPIVSQMVTVLLNGCRESDLRTRSLLGKCLGEIGAIDPGRLELIVGQPKEETSCFVKSMSDDNFAYELTNELAKTFLGAEDRTAQDVVAFALQRLIAIYNIRPETDSAVSGTSGSGRTTAGIKLWHRFSPDIREILQPLTGSYYKVSISNSSTIEHPIYRSRKGATFESWVCTLTSDLGMRLTSDIGRQVFEACRAIVKQGGDSRIALRLLPHMTLQVLLDGGPAAREIISMEVLAVLNDVKQADAARQRLPTDLRHMTAQTVFSLLDHLARWMRHRLTELTLPSTMSRLPSDPKSTPPAESDKNYRIVKAFLDSIPQDVIALASFNCGAYMRAFMHHELHVKKSSPSSIPADSFDFLLKLYRALEEPDGVAGVVSVQQSSPSLAQQILAFESVGRLSDAAVCYEHAIQSHPDDVLFRCGVLRNQLALGELNSALNLANGMIAENPLWTSELNTYQVEAAWRLGRWDKLQTYVEASDPSAMGWSTGLGKLLLAAKCKDEKGFEHHLQLLQQAQMAPLSAASMEAGSYQRGYEYIVRLHMLNELEEGLRVLVDFGSTASGNPDSDGLTGLSGHWRARLQYCQLSYRYQDPILNLRRIVLQIAKEERSLNVDPEIGQCWLNSAKVARECGLIQTAHSSLLNAANYRLPEFSMEKAKWLWEKGDLDLAQSCLEKAIEEAYPDRAKYKTTAVSSAKEPELSERLTCARMLLQLGRYYDETARWESNALCRQLKEVTQVHGEWEDGYFYVAMYYDKVMTAIEERPEKRGGYISRVVQFFGQSLLYGNQYIYQSMPRMLALWLDFGADVVAAESTEKSDAVRREMRESLSQLNRLMAVFCSKLAPYQFFVAFPQLISRICHAHPEVFAQLKAIIAVMLKEFMQQSVWMMMAVSKSSYPMRVKRCQEIFAQARSLRPDLAKFLSDMTKITDKLLDLCNRPVENMATTMLSIATHFKPLQRLLDDKDLSPILLPLQSQMTPSLPAMPIAPSSHVPFPSSSVYISGIEDTVDVLASLQRPKKITLLGSDGRRYALLCKPKDDLRKDARLMEFNGIVNRCLMRDAESRRRNLRIRTFTVTPLNEECGLLEWVSNTSGLRLILLKLYKKLGQSMTNKELKSLQLPPNAPLEKKLDTYRTKLLPRHPAVFSEWFLLTFPDPTSWYNARLAYCRTAAVMSMVGYVLGLGDRHGENILLDSTTGDCVHVDFNCLFNKGETFDYPEIVPFRLTPNMVEAMGLLGYEGVFRRSCEVTMRVMRDQMDPLMSVLKTFIYDPLVEWSKPAKGRGNPTESGEIRNEKAQTHVSFIEDRLRGILRLKMKSRGLPLSVEGQVSHLIKEATDENNLCQMYIGWAAFM